jgi:hypothetical protein
MFLSKWQKNLLKPSFEFKGFSWEELAECWNIEVPEDIDCKIDPFADEKWLAEKVKEKIYSIVDGDDIVDLQALSDLYAFVSKVAKDSLHSDKEAIKGLLKIVHPWSFVKWVGHNVEFLWT